MSSAQIYQRPKDRQSQEPSRLAGADSTATRGRVGRHKRARMAETGWEASCWTLILHATERELHSATNCAIRSWQLAAGRPTVAIANSIFRHSFLQALQFTTIRCWAKSKPFRQSFIAFRPIMLGHSTATPAIICLKFGSLIKVLGTPFGR